MSTKYKDKLRKNLAKSRKRRAGRTGQSLVNIKPASARVIERVTRDNIDLLQNIEFALADCYREDQVGMIDDVAVMKTLRQSLLSMVPDDPTGALLAEALGAVREFRAGVPDEVWNDAVRVVMASVHNHSSLAPGDTAYLDFMEPFVR